jgi:hypothetical protein
VSYIADSAPRAHFKYKVCVTAHEMRVWPLGVGLQEQAPKHLKLRRLRAEVVSVEEKAYLEVCQLGIRETSASEPLMRCRKLRTTSKLVAICTPG